MKKLLILLLSICFVSLKPKSIISTITLVNSQIERGQWIYIIPKKNNQVTFSKDKFGNYVINKDGVVFIDSTYLTNEPRFKLIDKNAIDISKNVKYFSSRVNTDNSISYFVFYLPSEKEDKEYIYTWNNIENIEKFTLKEIKREVELKKLGYNFF